MPIKSNTTPADHARAVRLVLAWIDSDDLAFNTAATEASRSKQGTSGVIYSLAAVAAMLGEGLTPHIRERLQGLLLPKFPDDDQDQQDQA